MALFKDVIQLVSVSIELDELLQEIEKPVKRDVFANKRSISQSEFFNAGQNGLKAQYVFDIRLCEYKGEDELIFDNKSYLIYRTFEKGEDIELYAQKKVGA